MSKSLLKSMNVLFYLKRSRTNKSGEMPIMGRITISKEKATFSTKLSIAPNLWSTSGNKAKGRSIPSLQLNAKLNQIKGQLEMHFQEMQINGKEITPEKLKNILLDKNRDRHTLLALFRDHNDDLEQMKGISVTQSTVQKYERTYLLVENFIKEDYNQKDMLFSDINHQFLVGLERYLRVNHSLQKNTAAKFIQRLKKIIIIAQNNGWLKTEPFANYKICFKKVDRGYLTQKELQSIMEKEFPIPRLELARDMFVFACFTGLSYTDVRNLTVDNLKESFDGKMWIMTKRQKTGTDSNLLLLDIPRQIIEKYSDDKSKKLLPILSNQRMNSYLKEIADLSGVKKNLTFHIARHTFATTITLAKGVPIETVSKMLGHTKISTTQIYARITDSKISDDMEKLSAQLGGFEESLNLSNGRKEAQ